MISADDLPAGVTRHVDRFGTVRFRARATIQGTRVSLGLFATPEEAGRVYGAAVEQQTAAGRGETLLSFGAKWLDGRELDGLHRCNDRDRSLWRAHIAAAPFATYPLRRISRPDVVRWVSGLLRTTAQHADTVGRGATRATSLRPLDRKLATQTIRNALGLLRRALGDAADQGLVAQNVALGVRVPRRPTSAEPWTFLSQTEIDALLAQKLTDAQRAIFTVAIYTGLRAGELWGLRWADVVFEGERPEIIVRHSYRGPTKGGRVRRVPLLRRAFDALKTWRAVAPGIGGALVFPAEIGDGDGLAGCHSVGYDAGFAKAKERAGIVRRVRFHDLRHSAASHLIMGTWGRAWRLAEVRDFLGHRSSVTTEKYAHLAPEGLHAARAETDLAGERRPSS